VFVSVFARRVCVFVRVLCEFLISEYTTTFILRITRTQHKHAHTHTHYANICMSQTDSNVPLSHGLLYVNISMNMYSSTSIYMCVYIYIHIVYIHAYRCVCKCNIPAFPACDKCIYVVASVHLDVYIYIYI